MSKDEIFFRNLHIKWQTNKNYHLWKSRCTIQSYFWIVGVFFAKVTRAFLLTKSIFEWKQKWLPLLSFQWYGLTSKIFWWKLHLQVAGTWHSEYGRNELQVLFFASLLQWVPTETFGGSKILLVLVLWLQSSKVGRFHWFLWFETRSKQLAVRGRRAALHFVLPQNWVEKC